MARFFLLLGFLLRRLVYSPLAYHLLLYVFSLLILVFYCQFHHTIESTVDLLQVVSYLYPIPSLIPFLFLISPDSIFLLPLELIAPRAAVMDWVRNYVVSMVAPLLLMEVVYLEME